MNKNKIKIWVIIILAFVFWFWGDSATSYNGLLVFIGWIFLISGIYLSFESHKEKKVLSGDTSPFLGKHNSTLIIIGYFFLGLLASIPGIIIGLLIIHYGEKTKKVTKIVALLSGAVLLFLLFGFVIHFGR